MAKKISGWIWILAIIAVLAIFSLSQHPAQTGLQATYQEINPLIIIVSGPALSSSNGYITATVTIKNTGIAMTQDYIWEIQPKLQGLQAAYVGPQSSCDVMTENVHKPFKLGAGESAIITLQAPIDKGGTYDVYSVVWTGCYDNSCKCQGELCLNCPYPILSTELNDKKIGTVAVTSTAIASCGDGKCTGGENWKTCPQDCWSWCGDLICDDSNSLGFRQAGSKGDQVVETDKNSKYYCPSDCGITSTITCYKCENNQVIDVPITAAFPVCHEENGIYAQKTSLTCGTSQTTLPAGQICCRVEGANLGIKNAIKIYNVGKNQYYSTSAIECQKSTILAKLLPPVDFDDIKVDPSWCTDQAVVAGGITETVQTQMCCKVNGIAPFGVTIVNTMNGERYYLADGCGGMFFKDNQVDVSWCKAGLQGTATDGTKIILTSIKEKDISKASGETLLAALCEFKGKKIEGVTCPENATCTSAKALVDDKMMTDGDFKSMLEAMDSAKQDPNLRAISKYSAAITVVVSNIALLGIPAFVTWLASDSIDTQERNVAWCVETEQFNLLKWLEEHTGLPGYVVLIGGGILLVVLLMVLFPSPKKGA